MVKQEKSRADRLAALRAKMDKQDTGVGSGFLRLEEGRTQVRILPEVGEMGWFFQPVGTHHFPDNTRVYCPTFTSEGELPCPVCEFVQGLYDAGDKSSRALAGKLRVRRKFWMNVIVRDDESAGPRILTAGVTIFSAIKQIVADPDYGDITDVTDGVDIKINRKGQGLSTEYEVIASRYESVLSEDDDQADEWLDKAKDLSYVELSDDPSEDDKLKAGHIVWVLPHDRISKELDLDGVLEEEEEEEEEPAPRRARKTRKRKKEEEELYDDDEDEEEEEEEEESDTRKEIRRRRARRRK